MQYSMVGLNVKGEELSGEPTAALRFTGVQRAASVGAPPANPSQVLRSSGYTAEQMGLVQKTPLPGFLGRERRLKAGKSRYIERF